MNITPHEIEAAITIFYLVTLINRLGRIAAAAEKTNQYLNVLGDILIKTQQASEQSANVLTTASTSYIAKNGAPRQ